LESSSRGQGFRGRANFLGGPVFEGVGEEFDQGPRVIVSAAFAALEGGIKESEDGAWAMNLYVRSRGRLPNSGPKIRCILPETSERSNGDLGGVFSPPRIFKSTYCFSTTKISAV
jgi:hypothetical protein